MRRGGGSENGEGTVSDGRPTILFVGGTSRPASTTERALRHCMAHAEALGAATRLIDGRFLSQLPLYDPDNPQRSDRERDFIAAVRACDGIVVATPGYHGSLSGPVKNALDWIEDTAGDQRPYLTDRAFGPIVTAYGWQACCTALVSLRLIAHALRAWPTPMGATVNAAARPFNGQGSCVDQQAAFQLTLVTEQVVEFCRMRRAL